ncbi:MAG: chemotaxis-specific protein-glutamate methyltransferase CheB [Gallionella sp.]|nr:chemotaxis-specific protein-glutamate methyltransferase CheB [Gallionella sp.]
MLRILIVEDSSVVALLLRAIFEQQADMQVVGHAKNGLEGVQMAHDLTPDVITMDIRMPVMDGFEATRLILADNPVPIVVVSSSVDDEELRITFRAIEEGALAVMEKPRGFAHPDFESIRRDLVDTVRAMSQVKLFSRKKIERTIEAEIYDAPLPQPGQIYELVAMGCSTGGPQALQQIFSLLPGHFPVPILVTQHISKGFVGGLAAWLSDNTQLNVKLAEQDETLKAGTIYFAPDDQHLLLSRGSSGLMVCLSQASPCNGFRPSVSPMFNSVAQICQHRAIGVLLTGMGEDGADGLLAMRSAGSHTVVQDEMSAVVYGMPGTAIALDAVDKVVALDHLPAYLSRLVREQALLDG